MMNYEEKKDYLQIIINIDKKTGKVFLDKNTSKPEELESLSNIFNKTELRKIKTEVNMLSKIESNHIIKPRVFKTDTHKQCRKDIYDLTVRNEQLTVKVEQLTVRNEQLTVKVEQLTVKVEQLTVRNEQLTVRNEQLTVRNEQLTVRNEQLSKEMSLLIKAVNKHNDEYHPKKEPNEDPKKKKK